MSEAFDFALRRIRRSLPSSAFIVALLAVVLALDAAILTVANGLLWAPLPYPQQERLVDLTLRSAKMDMALGWSKPFFKRVSESATTFDGVAAYLRKDASISDEANRHLGTVDSVRAQPELFRILGYSPMLGRSLGAVDTKEGAEPVVVVGEDFWKSRLGGDERVLSRSLVIGGDKRRIIGVMPKAFVFPARSVQVWTPLAFKPEEIAESNAGSFGGLQSIGRLADGRSFADATVELKSLTRSSPALRSIADSIDLQPEARPLRYLWLEDRAQSLLYLLAAAVLVFVVTQVNAYSLFLLRVARRRKEFATLESVGALPSDVRKQVVFEAAILCGVAAIVAAALLPFGIGVLQGLDVLPADWPRDVTIDARVISVCLAAVVASMLVFMSSVGILQGQSLYERLRQSTHGNASSGAIPLLRKALVIGQIALTLGLLAGTGLLLRSSSNVLNEDTGYARDGVVVGGLKVYASDEESDAQVHARFTAWLNERRAQPGVEAIALSSSAPLSKTAILETFGTSGTPANTGQPPPQAYQIYVGHDYFAALGMRITRGRAFTRVETSGLAPVAIVDERFAAVHFPGQDPLGKTVRTRDSRTDEILRATIVGVAITSRQRDVSESDEYPSLFLPDETPVSRPGLAGTTLEFVAKSSDPHFVAEGMAGNSAIEVLWSQPLSERIAETIADQLRLNLLLRILSAFAIALSCAGLYALLANAVQVRRNEFGIRLALGASPASIVANVLARGAGVVLAGLLCGLPLALWLGHRLQPSLHELSGHDPWTVLGATSIVAAVGVVANLLPAYRASQADPAQVLKSE